MSNFKVWPHLTLIALVCALVGGGAAALWFRNEPKAEAFAVPRAARVERVEGEVGVDRSLDSVGEEMLWEAEPNTPLTEGDRIYAAESSSAGVAFTGRNYARLDPQSSLDVLALSDRRTQLALREGSALFDLGELDEGEFYEVATPYGAVELREPGLYHLGMNDDGGGAFVSVLSGLAQVVGLAGSGQISKGEMLTLLGQTAAEIALSRLDPGYAGGLLDDYYGYRYPDAYDGRYSDYDAYLQDPYYFDPSERYQSYRHVSYDVPGAWELDRYGDWQEVGDYGYAWRPRVEPGWAPYQQGSWVLDEPYGLTWVSSEPWGYAPYHYGRWANVGGQWYWVPDRRQAAPSYAPALVAFLPVEQSNQIAWVPLAPGEAYAAPYYDDEWRPHYYGGGRQVVPERVVNFGVPGALTVVPADYFGRDIDRGVIVRAEPGVFERTRPVVEPFSHAMLRQASLTTANARRGFVLPPGLAKRLGESQVYTSGRPEEPRFKENKARAARVEAVPDERKREKLKFKDERRGEVAQQPAAPAPAAGRENRGRAAREAEPSRGRGEERRELRREERREAKRAERPEAIRPPQAQRPDVARPAKERKGRGAEQHAQGERVSMRPQPAARAARPPQAQARPQHKHAGGPPQARPQRAEQPRHAARQQSQPKAQRGGPPAGGGGNKQQRQSPGGGKGKGKGKG